MKKSLILSLVVLLVSNLYAQNIEETTIQYGDYTVPAYILTVEQNEDIATAALLQRIKESQVKYTKTNGYIAVLNQTFDVIYSQPVDFYARVESQGKKKNRTTVITFFAKSPNLTISQNELNVNVRRFAENFVPYIDKYEAQFKMNAEEKNLKKAKKEQEKAVSQASALEKSIAKDQEKILSKEKEIAKYQEKIESLRKDIEKLNSNIEKNKGKKSDADEKVNEANEKVSNSESEMERYRKQAEN